MCYNKLMNKLFNNKFLILFLMFLAVIVDFLGSVGDFIADNILMEISAGTFAYIVKTGWLPKLQLAR